ncbi:hypothetical protein B0J11DRAFT_489395 [Dendryphion nanum]|uniref:Uncharacterized protein n=1 Tax=Dendryphion nanum TaxID=256645 RepID=A0A9P9IJ29_9PLEO|nr:hypothetical protein B0J11DRAFT_489395 [Dendryphion nanum]
MSFLLKFITDCFTGGHDGPVALLDEKRPMLADIKVEPELSSPAKTPSSLSNDVLLADTVVQIMVQADMGGKDLQDKLNFIAGDFGWSQEVAICLLSILELELLDTKKLSPMMRDCRNRAYEAASEIDGFDIKEPAYRTLVALGVLVIAAPAMANALGFIEFGSVPGSYAEAWQSRYAAQVPRGSIFAFFLLASLGWQQIDPTVAVFSVCPAVYPQVDQRSFVPTMEAKPLITL